MRFSAFIACAVCLPLLDGCATTQTAAARCDVEPEKWIVLDAPPADAAALRRAAAAAADHLDHIELWFEGKDGALLLCQRPRPDAAITRTLGHGCGSSRWIFHRAIGGWHEPEYSYTWCHE